MSKGSNYRARLHSQHFRFANETRSMSLLQWLSKTKTRQSGDDQIIEETSSRPTTCTRKRKATESASLSSEKDGSAAMSASESGSRSDISGDTFF